MIRRLLLLLLALFTALPALSEEEPLRPDVAFRVEASQKNGNTFTITWRIADRYYLYHNKFRFRSLTPGISLGTARIPAGKKKKDPFFGLVETHRKQVTIELPFRRDKPAVNEVKLALGAQGCADIGICYPPYEKIVTVRLKPAAASNTPKKLPDLGRSLGLDSGAEEFLPPDKAFSLRTEVLGDGTVVARWQIAKGYYLYRKKFKFLLRKAPGNVRIGKIIYPRGQMKDDPNYGKMEVYHNNVELRIPVTGIQAGQRVTMEIGYQGCAEAGLCYPPQFKTVSISTGSAGTAIKSSTDKPAAGKPASRGDQRADSDLSDEEKLLRIFGHESLPYTLLVLLGFGLLLAFTACMYPMIPILSSIIVGHGDKITVGKGFTLSLVYVLAMSLTFGVIGGVFGFLGKAIGIQAYFQNPWVLSAFALLFVLLALSMFGFYNIQIPAALQSKLNEISNRQKGGSMIGVAIMGVLSALIIGPCGGPILIATIGGAAASDSTVHGFLYMFTLGFGMGLPLLAVGAGGGKLLPKAGDWMNAVKAVAGVILLAIALLILERMPQIIPPMLIMLLWSALFIVSAVYMGALDPVREDKGIYRFWKGLGVFLLVYGIIVMFGGLTGARNFNDPMHGSRFMAGTAMAPATQARRIEGKQTVVRGGLTFIKIKTLADFKRELAEANKAGKTVMLDFYADWCTYCKMYDEYVFPDPRVQQALRNTVLMVADVTAQDDKDKELQAAFNVPLPPAMLFFGTDGKEIRRYRVIGEMKADKFAARINKAFGRK